MSHVANQQSKDLVRRFMGNVVLDNDDLIIAIAAAIKEAVAQEREACLKIVREYLNGTSPTMEILARVSARSQW